MAYSVGLGYSAPTAQPVGNPRYENFIKAQLALAAWRYTKDSGGSHLAPIMVMHCLRNRHVAGWGTWLDIIDRMPKLSATLEIPTGFPDQWDRHFVKVLSEVDGVMDSTSKDLSNKALYFGDLSKVDNPWFIDNISRNPEHARVADMNTLVFWS